MNLGQALPGLVTFPAIGTPLGRLNFGGRLRASGGTGFDGFRVYGMYAVVVVTRGRGRYRDERGGDRDLGPGDLIVVFPDLAHQYGPPAGETWDEIFLAFEGAAFDAWRGEGMDPACPVWSIGPPARWVKRLAKLLRWKIGTRTDACAAAGELHLLIAEWLALRRIEAPPPWLDAARHALADPIRGQHLDAVARATGLSVDSFRRAFRVATGEPPARFHLRQRIAAGAALLHRRELGIREIAHMLRFYDEFHFSKAFKAQYGESPRNYRSNLTKPGLAKFNPQMRPLPG